MPDWLMEGIVESQRADRYDLRFGAQAASKIQQKLLFINSHGTVIYQLFHRNCSKISAVRDDEAAIV